MKNRLLICLFLLLSFKVYSQCTLNVTISQSAPSICSGTSVVLTATTSGGTAPFTYVWSTGDVTSSINVNKAGTYTVTVSDKTPGCQPVQQSITIGASPVPDAPTVASVVVCPNNSATLTATAPGGTYQWYDAATGGNFLASGATYTTPQVTANTVYYVETTVSGCTSPRSAVTVSISAKPTVGGASICAGSVATLSVSTGDSYTWYDAAVGGNIVGTNQTFTTPVLTTTTTYYVVVTTNGCSSLPAPVTATVTQAPPQPTASNITICSGSSANLHADAATGVFDWFTVPVGGVSLISSPDYTTPALTATTTYYVQTSLNGCESPRTQVTITVNPLPQAPNAQTDTICYQTSAVLTAGTNPAGTFQWYDAAAGGNLLATGVTYTTPVLTNSTTYYIQAVNGSCVSGRTPVNVVVNTSIPAPSVSGSIICSGSVTTLTATGPGGNYTWYDAATGGNLLGTGISYTTPPLTANTTYYVQTTISGCTSSMAAVTVSVLPVVAAPSAAGTSVCSGNPAILSATGSAGNYAWYDSLTGGNLLSQAQVYVTPALTATTTYYVEATTNNCTSSRTPVTVTVNPVLSVPTVSGASICLNTSASLTASATGGTIQWYDTSTGGNLLATGNTYNTPVLTTSATYYVQNTGAQCSSSRTPVTVTVATVFDPQFQYPSGTFCATGPNPTPVINNPAGGTFNAAPAGLVFVNNQTGQINISASTPGLYTISFTGNDACSGTTTASITIITTTNASFSYTGPYCQDGVNPLPTFPAGASGGNFSATPAGLNFVNTSTGEINLATSNPGIYTITNTINASGGCPANVATSTVTIDQRVIVSAGPAQTVPTGSAVQLAGSITGGATTGTWSGGLGTFSNPSLPNAVYTPAAGETTATLTLTSSDPPGPCGPKSAQVTITINSSPNTPVAASIATCAGSSATLSATAPGGTYQWYDAATGGNLLSTGPTFTTPALTVNTIYYVQTTIGGLTSGRTAVTVSINAIPAPPIAQGLQICGGSTATLTASGSTGAYEWYDAATGGNFLSTSNTYTTPALTANASYYVQAMDNNCSGTRTQVNVTVTPVPNVTSPGTGNVCSGTALNYTITADVATATFSWSRAQVAGTNNQVVTNQTSGTITETLINTTGAAVNVTYVITPLAGNCSGPAFNYVVTVYPTPIVNSPGTATICNGTTDNYAVTFSTPGVNFSWSRDTVSGISNAAVSGQTAGVIKEVLYNTTNAPVNVTYVFNYQTGNCAGTTFNLVITVNPRVVVTSTASGTACSGSPQNHVLTSNIPSATFSWSRAAVPGISNPAVTNQTSGTIDESLINTDIVPLNVIYIITPMANGCPGTPYTYVVKVSPQMANPIANSNSPVCLGTTINLSTPPVTNAQYLWTGPNGYTSTLQNPEITNVSAAEAGTYSLVDIVNGCSSPTTTVLVMIDQPPVANAGHDTTVCSTVPSITLAGSVTGGTSTGIWTTAGTGTFSPSSNVLNAQYIPSAADTTAGSVTLTLSSTSKDNCAISTSTMTIKFGPSLGVDAGPDQVVCSQVSSVQLNGKVFIGGGIKWSTSGTGTFSPSDTQINASYIPGAADVKNGSVKLTLLAVGAASCNIATSSMTIKLNPPPTVNAGGIRYVLKGNTITLYPTVNEKDVHYLWSPDVDINNDTLKNPVITGVINRTYTLTVTDSLGCVAQDTTLIKVSPEIKVVNTFTPNADGINDYWDITGLIAYPTATVDIFDRYGQKVFHSLGYPKPWDGTLDGKALPVGVYYYIVDVKLFGQLLTGWVTIIR
jgi:gliding motility-associated-like protein